MKRKRRKRTEREREVEAFMKQEAEKELVDTEERRRRKCKGRHNKIDPVCEHPRRARAFYMQQQARENGVTTTT